MALRSGNNSVSYWGRYATAAGATGLPNTAGATVQTAFLETGDIAFVTGTGVLYVCTTATVGAAVWAAVPMNFANTATAGPASAAGAAITALRSDATIPIAFGGDTQGDLPVRGAAAYERLVAVATGRVLQSGGVGALPAWGLPGPAIAVPNTFASADFNISTLTSPTLIGQTTTAAVNLTNANSLTFDIMCVVVKTNAGTNGITLKCPVGWNINGGTVSTDLLLPSSNGAIQGIWWIHTDIAGLTLHVHPRNVNGALWWWG